MKRTAAAIRLRLRPSRVAITPPINPPITQPIRALDTAKPSRELAAVSSKPSGTTKLRSRYFTVPEITAVSYPNNNPPKVATSVRNIR